MTEFEIGSIPAVSPTLFDIPAATTETTGKAEPSPSARAILAAGGAVCILCTAAGIAIIGWIWLAYALPVCALISLLLVAISEETQPLPRTTRESGVPRNALGSDRLTRASAADTTTSRKSGSHRVVISAGGGSVTCCRPARAGRGPPKGGGLRPTVPGPRHS